MDKLHIAIGFLLAMLLAIGIYLWFFSTPTRGLNVEVPTEYASNARQVSAASAKA
jgi:hypothetical protein